MPANIHKNKKQDVLFEQAASYFADALKRLVAQKTQICVGLPGGRSMPEFFKHVIKHDIPWSSVHVFIIDERLVPISHKDSNFLLVKEHLVVPLHAKLPRGNVHPFIYDNSVLDEGTKVYEKELASCGGKFDIIVLSAGEDGHIGALYPNHPVLAEQSRLFVTLHDSPKPPSDRMTSTVKLIKNADTAILFFMGDAKRGAFSTFKDSSRIYVACPAKLVLDAKHHVVYTDIM